MFSFSVAVLDAITKIIAHVNVNKLHGQNTGAAVRLPEGRESPSPRPVHKQRFPKEVRLRYLLLSRKPSTDAFLVYNTSDT